MTQASFERILELKDILWNDMVELEILSPYYERKGLRKIFTPSTIVFDGALGYHIGDPDVKICVEDKDNFMKTKFLTFSFDQIVDIRHLNKKNRKYVVEEFRED